MMEVSSIWVLLLQKSPGEGEGQEDKRLYIILMMYISIQHFDCYCILKGLFCSFSLSLLIFTISMMGLLICKYEALSLRVESWSLRPLINLRRPKLFSFFSFLNEPYFEGIRHAIEFKLTFNSIIFIFNWSKVQLFVAGLKCLNTVIFVMF